MEDNTIDIEALRSKGYCTADEYCKEKDEWRKIIMKAKELSPHFEDVIYKLTVWCYETQQPRYPEFRIHDAMHFYFKTLEEAQMKIPELIGKLKKERKETPSGRKLKCFLPYIFVIDEIPLGQELNWRDAVQAWWVYDKNGKLVILSLVSEIINEVLGLEPFFGRLPEMCPVKKGDIVEVVDGNDVRLEIVCALPTDPRSVLERIQRYREWLRQEHPEITDEELEKVFVNDYSDDCYITLDGAMIEGKDTYMCSHSHPSVKWVFPARMKVPEEVREKLEACLKKVEEEAKKLLCSLLEIQIEIITNGFKECKYILYRCVSANTTTNSDGIVLRILRGFQPFGVARFHSMSRLGLYSVQSGRSEMRPKMNKY